MDSASHKEIRSAKIKGGVSSRSYLRELTRIFLFIFPHLEQLVQSLSNEEEIAPPRCWISRYQARGKTKNYWYYKWQSQEPIFPTESGKKTRYRHLGKAGSQAYLEAVTSGVHRATFEGLQQAISTPISGFS